VLTKKLVQGGPTPGKGAPTLSRSLTRLDLVVIGMAQIIGSLGLCSLIYPAAP
jgi:hypothetical protein